MSMLACSLCSNLVGDFFCTAASAEDKSKEKWYTAHDVAGGDGIKLESGKIVRYASLAAPNMSAMTDYEFELAKEATFSRVSENSFAICFFCSFVSLPATLIFT